MTDTTEIEELHNDVLAVADNVKWIRSEKENERQLHGFGSDIKSKRSKEKIEVEMEPSTTLRQSMNTFHADDLSLGSFCTYKWGFKNTVHLLSVESANYNSKAPCLGIKFCAINKYYL